MRKVKITSLGCAKNLVDAEVMAGLLQKSGFMLTDREEDADVIVVNTCGFVSDAKEESVEEILQAAQHKKHGGVQALVVTGCLAQRYSGDILEEIPEVDALIGTGEIPRIAEVVSRALAGGKPAHVDTPSFIYNHEMPRVLLTPGYSAYIKVAEGCSNRCSYCAIPAIRGDFRSRPLESIVAEARNLAAQGVKEINLIAQDTTRYGEDLYGSFQLAGLLRQLAKIDGLPWIRILYSYPSRITDELIDVMASTANICRYLDIPLQHADDRILKAMNRPHTREQILKLLEKLRRQIPDLTLRTTFIVGFPGETEEAFENLVSFVREARFDRVGVFAYSPEEGTPACSMPGQVPAEVKEERKDMLLKIQQEISLAKNRAKVGQVLPTLIEGPAESGGMFAGRTQADAPEVDGTVLVRGQGLAPGSIVPVRITHAYEYDLIGEIAE